MADDSATSAELLERRARGEVAAADYLGLVQSLRDTDYWHAWAMRALLVLGGGHFLAGVVFFFAYNWQDLSSFAKFAILEVAIVAAVVAALLLRLERPAGRAVLIAASVFTGVLLAVIGQTYQTGADAWQLFAAWSLLILPWALGSSSGAHAFLWAVVSMTAITLYGEQRLVALGHLHQHEMTVIIGLVPLVFLAAREAALWLGADWLAAAWLRRALVVMSLGVLFFPAIEYIVGTDYERWGLIAYVAVTIVVTAIYTRPLPDFPVIAIVAGFDTLVAMAIGGRVIQEAVGFGESAEALVFSLFLLGGWCALVTTVAVKLLRRLYARMAVDDDDPR